MSELLQQKIDKLEKRLAREKNARKQAERLLEQKSEEIYCSTLTLKQRIEDSEQKQSQLEFLTSVSADTIHAQNVDELVKQFISRSQQFLACSECYYLTLDITKSDAVKLKSLTPKSSDSQTFARDLLKLKPVELLQQANFESQLLDLTQQPLGAINIGYCYLVPILRLKQTLGLACYYFKEEGLLNILNLQTMESARVNLNVAVRQKVTKLKLQHRYKQLENTYEQLSQTQKQLVHSEKMASLGQLAAGVAHEINNPVGFVMSNYQTLVDYMAVMDKLLEQNALLLEQKAVEPEFSELSHLWQNEDIDFIRTDLNDLLTSSQNGLKRVQEIVAGLKSFSHSDDIQSHNISLNDCLEEAVNLVWNQLKYDCEIEKRFAESLPDIKGKQGQLQQVFVNMLVNAKQAMEAGGTVTVRTALLDKYIQVEIEDTGCGINQEDLEKLFTPFYTTKPVGVGTGLGLSISYGILQEHNAEIKVDSQISKGTCFTMLFPLPEQKLTQAS